MIYILLISLFSLALFYPILAYYSIFFGPKQDPPPPRSKIIYVASPYSKLSHERAYTQALGFIGTQAGLHPGKILYSPIVYWHNICKFFDLPTTAKYWENQNMAYLEICDHMIVLKLHGWDDSVGVLSEIDYCVKNNIKIVYIDPPY